MSASNEYFTWHLTPRGWEEGTEKLDSGTTTRPVPADTVLTLEFHERLSSVYSSFERWIETDFKNPKEAEVLKQKFGTRPREMAYFKSTKMKN